jgi:YkoY family integral membrane protein
MGGEVERTPKRYTELTLVPQTFASPDLLVIGMLALLEGLLSADNALVLALLVRHLPAKQQQSALSLGLIMAFALRAVGILLAAILIKLWWLCAIGAAYLIFLAVKHFLSRRHDEDDETGIATGKKSMSYGKTIMLVGLTDVVFAVDSILVAVALVDTAHHPDKLWVVYVGGLIGVIALRLTAAAFIRLLRRYPDLDHTAYGLVAWAGVKLGFSAGHLWQPGFPEMPKWLFWFVFLGIVLVGSWIAMRHGPKDEPRDTPITDEELGERLTDDSLERLEKLAD